MQPISEKAHNKNFCTHCSTSVKDSAQQRQLAYPININRHTIMYAIVEILGQQFKAEAGKRLFVHRMQEAEQGATVEFENVLLVDNDGNIAVGTPTVAGAKVVAEVLSHVRGEKVLVFKKKRRKGYDKLNGHRQNFTEILVKEIVA